MSDSPNKLVVAQEGDKLGVRPGLFYISNPSGKLVALLGSQAEGVVLSYREMVGVYREGVNPERFVRYDAESMEFQAIKLVARKSKSGGMIHSYKEGDLVHYWCYEATLRFGEHTAAIELRGSNGKDIVTHVRPGSVLTYTDKEVEMPYSKPFDRRHFRHLQLIDGVGANVYLGSRL